MNPLTDKDFLNEAYLSLLDRLPDQNGLNVYISWLEKGRTRIDIVYAILASEEFFKKTKNWTNVHSKLFKLCTGLFNEFKNYPAMLEQIAIGKRLPSKQNDLSKLISKKFIFLHNYLLHLNRIIPKFGIVLDICDHKNGLILTEFKSESLKFFFGGIVLNPIKFGNQHVIPVGSDANLKLEIKYNGELLYSTVISEANIEEGAGALSVAIVGRFETSTSIGGLSLTLLHHLFDNFDCKLIDTRPDDSRWSQIDTRFGKARKIESEVSGVDIAIYTDVFSNSLDDLNYKKVPDAQIKIAYVVFDSTHLPSWWVDSLNTTFDAVITTSKWGKKMIENSGVNVPVFYLPLSLDFSLFNAERLRKNSKKKFRFGSVASFSARKNVKQLIDCFIECFDGFEDVELLIHSPLSYGFIYDEVIKMIDHRNIKNIIISHEELDEYNYASLLNTFDVYVLLSKGECYSITPRQAFALGKPAIISSGHAHDEMIESGLFSAVNVMGYEPAVFEAFAGQAIGLQCRYESVDISKALRHAYFRHEELLLGSRKRTEYAHTFSHEQLKHYYLNIVCPKNIFLGTTNEILKEGIVVNSSALYRKFSEVRNKATKSDSLRYKFQKIVVPLHDGGFYSVFNTFISHFVWNYGRPDVAVVIPDWRIATLRSYRNVESPMSFCYGTEADGNIFTKLFLPIPDMPVSLVDYSNDSFLSVGAVYYDNFNEINEPLLTYVNARELYKQPDFPEWRRRYGRFYKKYFRITDSLNTMINAIVFDKFKADYIIGVHVKHPSHSIEQPNGLMPGVSTFIKNILNLISNKKISSYQIFLATDQDAVVSSFAAVFGERLIFRNDVTRTSITDDSKYASLDKRDQLREGHQIQNLVAADRTKWSLKMAEDVMIDAHLLASCHSFLHVTSNIATAVSYINPEIEMIYCE